MDLVFLMGYSLPAPELGQAMGYALAVFGVFAIFLPR